MLRKLSTHGAGFATTFQRARILGQNVTVSFNRLAHTLPSCEIDFQHIKLLTKEDHDNQKKYGKLGKSIFHRYFVNETGNYFECDMRFMELPRRPDARKGFENYSKEAESLITEISSKRFCSVNLLDSSAKGKTSLIFQVASHWFMIYVVACSESFRHHTDGAYVELVSNIRKVAVSNLSNEEKTAAAEKLINLDLYCRMALLQKYLEICLASNGELEASPKTFLLLQLNFGNTCIQKLSEDVRAGDEFAAADLESWQDQLMKAIEEQIRKVNELRADKGEPILPLYVGVAVNEAQSSATTLLSKDSKDFHFTRRGSDAPVGMLYKYTHAIFQLKQKRGPLNLSGTGFTHNVLLQTASPMAGKVSNIVSTPTLPYLSSSDILDRYKLCLNMEEVDTNDEEFVLALANLEGRPWTSTAVIEKHLARVVAENPDLSATGHLTEAMLASFDDMVDYFVNVVCIKLNHSAATDKLVRRIFALIKLGGKVGVRELCRDQDDRDRLTAAALCFPITHDEIRYDEPVLREVIKRVAARKLWNLSDILHEQFFSDLNKTSRTTGQNFKLETVFALQMAQKDGKTVTEFLEPFMRHSTTKLPEWTKKATLQFKFVDLMRSEDMEQDLLDIREVVNGKESNNRSCQLWMPTDRLGPDLFSVNPQQGYALLCGVRWLSENITGEKYASLLSSVDMERMGLNKAGEPSKNQLHNEEVINSLATKNHKNQNLHELRVLCTFPNTDFHSSGDATAEKNVKVDGDTVTLTINSANFHNFFCGATVAAMRKKMQEHN